MLLFSLYLVILFLVVALIIFFSKESCTESKVKSKLHKEDEKEQKERIRVVQDNLEPMNVLV